MAKTHTITLPGGMLERGFWLYVWRVATPKGEMLYVGRTGDSSSHKAAPPYTRMGQHLGHVKASNALRRHLESHSVSPEDCDEFLLICHGPLFSEESHMTAHKVPRDIVAALEKKLADSLSEAGYNVMNRVHSRKVLDEGLWATVRDSFLEHFPKIGKY